MDASNTKDGLVLRLDHYERRQPCTCLSVQPPQVDAAERECREAWAHARVEAKPAEYRGGGKLPRGIRNAESGRFAYACPDLDQEYPKS